MEEYIECPQCASVLSDEIATIGSFFYCLECEKNYEVVELEPLRLIESELEEY